MRQTSNGFVLRGLEESTHTGTEQRVHTVAIGRNSSICCNCGADIRLESDPCPLCKITFMYAVFGNIGGGNIRSQIDKIALMGFGLTALGTYSGNPGEASFEVIRKP